MAHGGPITKNATPLQIANGSSPLSLLGPFNLGPFRHNYNDCVQGCAKISLFLVVENKVATKGQKVLPL